MGSLLQEAPGCHTSSWASTPVSAGTIWSAAALEDFIQNIGDNRDYVQPEFLVCTIVSNSHNIDVLSYWEFLTTMNDNRHTDTLCDIM